MGTRTARTVAVPQNTKEKISPKDRLCELNRLFHGLSHTCWYHRGDATWGSRMISMSNWCCMNWHSLFCGYWNRCFWCSHYIPGPTSESCAVVWTVPCRLFALLLQGFHQSQGNLLSSESECRGALQWKLSYQGQLSTHEGWSYNVILVCTVKSQKMKHKDRKTNIRTKHIIIQKLDGARERNEKYNNMYFVIAHSKELRVLQKK